MDKKNNILMGIFCIVVAGFGFSLMSLFIKLAGDLPSMQKGFFQKYYCGWNLVNSLNKALEGN